MTVALSVSQAIGAVILALVLLSRKKKLFAAGIVVVVIGVIAAGVLANTTGIGQTLKKTVVGTYHMKDQFSLNDIKTNTDDVELDIWNNPLYVSYDLGSDGVITVVCKDADGQEIQTTEVDQENHILALNDERFANIQIQPIMFTDNTAGIKMIIDGVEWDFSKNDTDGYEYLNPAGKLVKFENPKVSNVFLDDAMSNRGHIWNKTIPLLGKHAFMGSGANTYMFEVPQEDYISQNYVYGANSYDVKAHDAYIKQASHCSRTKCYFAHMSQKSCIGYIYYILSQQSQQNRIGNCPNIFIRIIHKLSFCQLDFKGIKITYIPNHSKRYYLKNIIILT